MQPTSLSVTAAAGAASPLASAAPALTLAADTRSVGLREERRRKSLRWFKRKRRIDETAVTAGRCLQCGGPLPPTKANKRSGVCKSCRRAAEREQGNFTAGSTHRLAGGVSGSGSAGVWCSICGRPLEALGDPRNTFAPGTLVVGPGTSFRALEQWRGLVCLKCRRVYCVQCIGYDGLQPRPCPQCGSEPVPAFRRYLVRVRALPRG